MLVVFAIGVGLGSLLCERLSAHKIEIGLVPFGSIGLTLFILDLSAASPTNATSLLSQPESWRILADLVSIGVLGGFYIVPLYALIQSRSEPAHRARIIAANSILNALFMVLAAAFGTGPLAADASIPQMFLACALLNTAVALYIYLLVPEFLIRFLAWMLIHSIYRLRKRGLKNIPETGPALPACNHVSYVDALVILAASQRPVRFLMDHEIFRTPVLNFVFRTSKAIPIASAREDAALLQAASDEVARALRNGDLVGILPKGKTTLES